MAKAASPAVLVNGQPPADAMQAIAVNDRGLNYGDGLFETALLENGSVRFLEQHLTRLREGCGRLGIDYPGDDLLIAEIKSVSGSERHGVVKVVVTRGSSGRGYRPAPVTAGASATRIVTLHPAPAQKAGAEIKVRWCDVRLSRNAALAGMKHLNRLEQVLAQGEWSDAGIGEGLMLDTEGELVCATAGNVFIVRNHTLLTPDLRFCGVRGVMRDQVLRAARQAGLPANEEPLWPHDLDDATEVFITNAVHGIRPVVAVASLQWNVGTFARQLMAALDL